jgi:hypothetical protein
MLDDIRIGGFLKDDNIRLGGADYFGYFTFAPAPAEADVVAKQLNNHEAGASITIQ